MLNKRLLMICVSLFLINGCKSIDIDDVPIKQSEKSVLVVQKVQPLPVKKIQEVISQQEVGFSENKQNSGIIDFNENGWQIDEKTLNKYNSLVLKYGKDFDPTLKQNDGVSLVGGNIYLSQEYMVKFAEMNLKNKGILYD